MSFIPVIINPVQVRYVKTIVGWYNLYLADYPEKAAVNVSPEQFAQLFPAISPKTRLGCDQMDFACAESLFGSLKELKIA